MSFQKQENCVFFCFFQIFLTQLPDRVYFKMAPSIVMSLLILALLPALALAVKPFSLPGFPLTYSAVLQVRQEGERGGEREREGGGREIGGERGKERGGRSRKK